MGTNKRRRISHKFTRQMVEHMLEEIGFTPEGWYTDERRLFGLALGGTGACCSEEMFGEGY